MDRQTMLTLVNTNRMVPPIGPVGLDYVAGAARRAGIEVEVLDLGLAENPDAALRDYFARRNPRLVGLSFRNADDCFWPSAEWFVPRLGETVRTLRGLTDAAVVLGGVGFSIFAEQIVASTGADYGIRGDGEASIVELYRALDRGGFEAIPGLLWRTGGELRPNAPAWPEDLALATARDAIDNAAYFRLGGQGGVETKRGCPRRCIYCADPLAKGAVVRPRAPAEVADEVESLLAQGVDVLHLCDGEFNVPYEHALAVCEQFARRGLGRRVRWYTYMAVTPLDAVLAAAMARAGCAGIDFTADSADAAMLARYGHSHGRDDLARAAALCKANGIAVMFDLLLGGPGETPTSVAETIAFMKRLDPDAVGAALGMRIYPGTPAAETIAAEGPMESNPAIRRRYGGPVDLARPTFYIAAALGETPARRVRDLIGGDERFFAPAEAGDAPGEADSGYNYNDNAPLVKAIEAGARGAYWHILRKMRGAQ